MLVVSCTFMAIKTFLKDVQEISSLLSEGIEPRHIPESYSDLAVEMGKVDYFLREYVEPSYRNAGGRSHRTEVSGDTVEVGSETGNFFQTWYEQNGESCEAGNKIRLSHMNDEGAEIEKPVEIAAWRTGRDENVEGTPDHQPELRYQATVDELTQTVEEMYRERIEDHNWESNRSIE